MVEGWTFFFFAGWAYTPHTHTHLSLLLTPEFRGYRELAGTARGPPNRDPPGGFARAHLRPDWHDLSGRTPTW